MTDQPTAEDVADLRRRLAEAELDRDALRKAERERGGPPPSVVRPPGEVRFFRQEDLANVTFFREHRAEILEAIRRGHILPRADWQVPGAQTAAERAARKAGTTK